MAGWRLCSIRRDWCVAWASRCRSKADICLPRMAPTNRADCVSSCSRRDFGGTTLVTMVGEIGHMVVGAVVRVEWGLELAEREIVDLALLDVNLNGKGSIQSRLRSGTGETRMKGTGREVLKRAVGVLAGLGIIGCARQVLSEEPQQRRKVIVNGKRVRTVDVHAHCHIPEANALMGFKVPQPSLLVSPERIKAMDEQGIDVEALSINPIFWYKAEPDLTAQVVKLQNEKLAEICAAQPDRFVGMASVALQHPALAAAQL